ncbi:MAG: hypothetical protein OSJ27_07940 [Candidatus Gastranaerophilales bacterium]|nr:hypothetical protein [Candidatus Gastranaerophilales bacterium]
MGMSASQSRFLMLTAQKSNNEYQAQTITFERLMLADNVARWTNEYEDAMQNQTLLYGQRDSDNINYAARLHYDDIVRASEKGGMSMSLISATSNKIVVPSLPDPLPEGKTREDYFICPDVNNADFLEKNLREGNFLFVDKDAKHIAETPEEEWNKYHYTDSTIQMFVTDTYDKTDDAAAQSKYNERQEAFQRADKLLECQLKKLETEHKALETEIESVQKVIKTNVEASFKTFG